MSLSLTKKSIGAVNQIISVLADKNFTVDEANDILSYAHRAIRDTSTVKKVVLPTNELPED
jgi:hypothetical protein